MKNTSDTVMIKMMTTMTTMIAIMIMTMTSLTYDDNDVKDDNNEKDAAAKRL